MKVMFTGTEMLTGVFRGGRALHSARDTNVTRSSHIVSTTTQTNPSLKTTTALQTNIFAASMKTSHQDHIINCCILYVSVYPTICHFRLACNSHYSELPAIARHKVA